MRSTPEVPRETVNGSSIAIAPRKQIGSDGALVRFALDLGRPRLALVRHVRVTFAELLARVRVRTTAVRAISSDAQVGASHGRTSWMQTSVRHRQHSACPLHAPRDKGWHWAKAVASGNSYTSQGKGKPHVGARAVHGTGRRGTPGMPTALHRLVLFTPLWSPIFHDPQHCSRHHQQQRVLLIVGGLNWRLVGAFDFDLVAAIFGPMTLLSRLVYVLVGLAAL